MIKVAITGNIASGKTSVQKIIQQSGYRVIDTDKIGHKLLDSLPEVKGAFAGYDILTEHGNISREKLGEIVFTNPELKVKLEKIIHPAVKQEVLNFFEQNGLEEAVFVSIPLLFESDMRNIFDRVLLIYADDAIRKERLLSRNKYSQEYAQLRMNSQMPQDEKKHLSDFVIYNNGTLADLEKSTGKFLKQMLTR